MKKGAFSSISLIIIISFCITFTFNTNHTRENLGDGDDVTFRIAERWNLTGTLINIDDTIDSKNWSRTADDNPWCNGNGTISDPFIIENVTVNGQNLGSCISINNSKVYFIIRNCILCNSSVGIMIRNATNVKIFNNFIVDINGQDGSNGVSSGDGGPGENGTESIGIAIYDSININISLNQISNISGGNGGLGGDGDMAFPPGPGYNGGNGGNGNNSYAIFLANSDEIFISHNNISIIKGGDGGNGGNGGLGIESAGGWAGNGGNAGLASGLFFNNSKNIATEYNYISNIQGGIGGDGGNCVRNNSDSWGGEGGDGNYGGLASGLYFETSANITNNWNIIISIQSGDGGNGGLGGDYGFNISSESNCAGGNGSHGGLASGLYLRNSTNITNNWNDISNITSGFGGNGGDAGHGVNGFLIVELPPLWWNACIGGPGGNGGHGGLASGLCFQSSAKITINWNNISNIISSDGGNGGNGGAGGNDTQGNGGHGGAGGNGSHGGLVSGLFFESSANITNNWNVIRNIFGSNGGIGGIGGVGGTGSGSDGTDGDNGLNGTDSIGNGFFLINSNNSLSYLNSIFCENTTDNGRNNQWNNSFIGNYWDDYIGFDNNNDGIGDTPYNISGIAGSNDYFPILVWDDTPPSISNIQFNLSVTLDTGQLHVSCNVMDNLQLRVIKPVEIRIYYPNGTVLLDWTAMTHYSGDLYTFNWDVTGHATNYCYSFTIRASDFFVNFNESENQQFDIVPQNEEKPNFIITIILIIGSVAAVSTASLILMRKRQKGLDLGKFRKKPKSPIDLKHKLNIDFPEGFNVMSIGIMERIKRIVGLTEAERELLIQDLILMDEEEATQWIDKIEKSLKN